MLKLFYFTARKSIHKIGRATTDQSESIISENYAILLSKKE